jgi:4-hydroxy-L-threonine phosphate dehydrogenase PdxA
MGDVAGVGPEVIARAWADEPLRDLARPFVVGDSATLRRAVALLGSGAEVRAIARPDEAEPTARVIPCLDATDQDPAGVRHGKVDARASRAASDFLSRASSGSSVSTRMRPRSAWTTPS